MARVRLSWLAALLLLVSTRAMAEVKLPAIFGDHMVLQQEQELRVWGWAAPAEKVRVEIAGHGAEAQASATGEWQVTLKALKTGGPHTLLVSGATNQLKCEDVLVGEVWVCSGQSNMDWWVGDVNDAAKEIEAANYPQMRYFRVAHVTAASPASDLKGKWVVVQPDAMRNSNWDESMSAVGYFFGRELHQQLKRPVGLVVSAWGGTPVEPWTPPVGFASEPKLDYLNVRAQKLLPGSPAFREDLGKLIADQRRWVTDAEAALQAGTPPPPIPTAPAELKPERGPGDPLALYNSMIHPIERYGIRGAIWYQGEGNHLDADYDAKMAALIGGWRKVWGIGDFPFFFVQIAPFDYPNEPETIIPGFWEQQVRAAREIPNSGLVVINDIANLKDIHPRNKQDVGHRLALWAFATTYGKHKIDPNGPTFEKLTPEGARLRVTFSHTGGKLASRDGKPLSHFEVVDRDKGGFVPATAEIDGDSVLLSAAGVANPVAMRFAWSKLAEPNLMNEAGLPASAFRAGEVPQRDRVTLEVPEAADYQLVYDLDLAKLLPEPAYSVDRHADIKQPIERVAYLMELGESAEKSRYVWVSMDAFTQNAAQLGVPTVASGAKFQQAVSNLLVASNTFGFQIGKGFNGRLEFWPNNYAQQNVDKVGGANDQVYDTGDMPVDPALGYGSMQIHNLDANQTILALNNWRAGAKADVGIGPAPGANPDWTFVNNADREAFKRLRVYVKLK